ncbi:TonB-dependent receptor [Phenylobacterium immobile]|uniref:TonB-dependent receptor n=1 Tax=Phenylobacterium immobile TaxID=21 RepID=UPI000A96C774|nr:TonB-dependent receptor [Phenylobacterium immobile]
MNTRALLIAAASITALSAGRSLAETAPGDVQELVVTAQKRDQRALDVPFALTAYGAADIDRLGVQEFEELAQIVPGFEVQNQSPNNPALVMRGITSDSGDATAEPRVSVYQDGVSISRSRGSYVELFDIERVEIAKGPQSTLFGRGALIGAVNVIQAKARSDWEATARASVGNYGYTLFEGMLNAPLGDNAALRISGRQKARDGYVENALGATDFNSVDTQAYRVALNAHGERFNADLLLNYQKDDPSGTSFKSMTFNPTDPLTGMVLGDRPAESPAALSTTAGFEGGRPLGLDRELWSVTGLLSFDLTDALTLNSVSAYRRFDALEIFDADGFSAPLFVFGEDARGRQASQEIRLNYNAGGRWSGFVGVNYFHEDGSQRVPLQFDERTALALLTGQLSRPNPQPSAVTGSNAFAGALLQGLAAASGVAVSSAQAQAIAANLRTDHRESYINSGDTDAWDIYGDVTFKATGSLELTGGLRYTRDDRSAGYASTVSGGRSVLGGFIGALSQPAAVRAALLAGLSAPGAALIPTSAQFPVPMFGLFSQPSAGAGALQTSDFTDEGFTWRVSAKQALSPNANLYATYARGRRPKVMSPAAPAAPGGAARFTEVAAETVDSFELGAKGRFIGGRLALDGALYHYDYNNFQTTIQQNAQLVTANAGEAKAYGFEGQATLQAADHLTVNATYAYNHSRFGNGLFEDNRFRLSPDHTASLGADWRIPVRGGEFSVRPLYTWQSKVFFDDDNDIAALQRDNLVPDAAQDELQASYGLANLRVGYTAHDATWSVEAFVTNLFDKTYLKDAGNTGDTFGIPTFIAGEPRFWGLSVTFRR